MYDWLNLNWNHIIYNNYKRNIYSCVLKWTKLDPVQNIDSHNFYWCSLWYRKIMKQISTPENGTWSCNNQLTQPSHTAVVKRSPVATVSISRYVSCLCDVVYRSMSMSKKKERNANPQYSPIHSRSGNKLLHGRRKIQHLAVSKPLISLTALPRNLLQWISVASAADIRIPFCPYEQSGWVLIAA